MHNLRHFHPLQFYTFLYLLTYFMYFFFKINSDLPLSVFNHLHSTTSFTCLFCSFFMFAFIQFAFIQFAFILHLFCLYDSKTTSTQFFHIGKSLLYSVNVHSALDPVFLFTTQNSLVLYCHCVQVVFIFLLINPFL